MDVPRYDVGDQIIGNLQLFIQSDREFPGLMSNYALIYDKNIFDSISASFSQLQGRQFLLQNHDFDSDIENMQKDLKEVIAKVDELADFLRHSSLSDDLEEIRNSASQRRSYEEAFLNINQNFFKSFTSLQAKARQKLEEINPEIEQLKSRLCPWPFSFFGGGGETKINEATISKLSPIFYALDQMWKIYAEYPRDAILKLGENMTKRENEEKKKREKIIELRKGQLEQEKQAALDQSSKQKQQIVQDFAKKCALLSSND